MQDKKTVGRIALELAQKAPESRDPIEIGRENTKKFVDDLIWAVKHAKKQVDCSSMPGHENCKNTTSFDGDFYVVIETKRERLMDNTLRHFFVTRRSCPTPKFDQSVFRYNAKNEELEYVWTVPDKITCIKFTENALKIVPEERGLLEFVLDFNSGELLRKAKMLNGESLIEGLTLEEN